MSEVVDSGGGGSMTRPGVLLDRDGTIIVDSGYVGSIDRVEFLEGSIDAIANLNAAGIPVAVVTNQAGIARGYYGLADVDAVHSHIDAELARQGAHVDMWLFCPYHSDGVVDAFARTSADRKPGPGMAIAAAEALRPRPVELLGSRRQRCGRGSCPCSRGQAASRGRAERRSRGRGGHGSRCRGPHHPQ